MWEVARNDYSPMCNIGHKSNRLNKFAETNADIVVGMEKSAATFAALGQSWNDAFALFTGAQEVMQNADIVGTALKTKIICLYVQKCA